MERIWGQASSVGGGRRHAPSTTLGARSGFGAGPGRAPAWRLVECVSRRQVWSGDQAALPTALMHKLPKPAAARRRRRLQQGAAAGCGVEGHVQLKPEHLPWGADGAALAPGGAHGAGPLPGTCSVSFPACTHAGGTALDARAVWPARHGSLRTGQPRINSAAARCKGGLPRRGAACAQPSGAGRQTGLERARGAPARFGVSVASACREM
jgi:hypothetical protein